MVLAAFAEASAPGTICRDPAFLDADTCLRVRRAMDAGRLESAEVLHDTIEHQNDVRRAAYIDVADDVLAGIEARLDAQRERLAAFFGIPLTAREGAGLVRYPEGGYYRPHRDRADTPAWPDAANRRIAIVVFLNSSRASQAEGDFSGGVLRLLDDRPVDVVPRAGTLVAFGADRLHEVTSVRGGVRDVIVDWFY